RQDRADQGVKNGLNVETLIAENAADLGGIANRSCAEGAPRGKRNVSSTMKQMTMEQTDD
uniref:hypothetical protein n=1 Tax=Herpetosiphon llansteffanensis TaxID=2094568 RepID=UPI00196A3691